MIWNFVDKKFEIVPNVRTFRDALVYFQWYGSSSAAQKAIEQGRIEYGQPESIRMGISKWVKVLSWKESIPSGWPIVIRKKSPYPISMEVCSPTPDMRRLLWTRIWNEKPINWFWDLISRFKK